MSTGYAHTFSTCNIVIFHLATYLQITGCIYLLKRSNKEGGADSIIIAIYLTINNC